MLEITKEQKEQGRWLFSGDCNFVLGIQKPEQLPAADLPEIAFVGLSNVGKSSLINALTGRKSLARTSNTPGATRQINFFNLRERLFLVDLPGYGYAKVSKKEIKGWSKLIFAYLKSRPQLRRVCLLIDARRGPKESDKEIMSLLDDMAVVYQIVLTKTDKVKQDELAKVEEKIKAIFAKHPALHNEIIKTSCRKDVGIAYLRAIVAELIVQ